MRNLLKPTLAACALVAVFMVASGKANADPLVLSLQNTSLTGVAGGSVTFFASATNTGTTNTNTDTIVGGSFSIPVGSIDLSPFSLNWGIQQVLSGATRGPLALFTINIPVGTLDGSYSGGLVSLFYTSGGVGNAILTNSVDFTVRVGPAPVPEPATMLLLGTGLVGIAAKVRQRRKAV